MVRLGLTSRWRHFNTIYILPQDSRHQGSNKTCVTTPGEQGWNIMTTSLQNELKLGYIRSKNGIEAHLRSEPRPKQQKLPSQTSLKPWRKIKEQSKHNNPTTTSNQKQEKRGDKINDSYTPTAS